tara:strand:+ start:97301 stop:97405 length:105 start_codon:yes stop_codon:yes gene_type:complete
MPVSASVEACVIYDYYFQLATAQQMIWEKLFEIA